MKKPLLDVIFASDKRKNVLLLLKEGPKETENLLSSLETTRQSLLPQIRILEEHHLITHYEDSYELTTLGEMTVSKMQPLIDTLKVFDNNIDYWGNHYFDFIPSHLLKRIDELGESKIIVPPIPEIFEFNKEVHEISKKSSFFVKICSSMHPKFFTLFTELAELGVEMTFLISEDLLDYLKREKYEEFRSLLENEKTNFYLYQEKMQFFSIVLNDQCVLLRLLQKDGSFSNLQAMFTGESAVNWGKELTEYFKQSSVQIMDV